MSNFRTQITKITDMSEQIMAMTKEKMLDQEKIILLHKEIGQLTLDIENVKSENLHLDIKVKDNSDMIDFLKKNLENKSMALEEYYQKYVQVYMDHYHLKNKHTVLSNRFAQYELIVKTSKSMLEALRNRKNAKIQTDLVKNHDIAIMTDVLGKDLAKTGSGVIPSVSEARSEVSLYPTYNMEENKEKVLRSALSYNNKDFDNSQSNLVGIDDSEFPFRMPPVSQKTIGTGDIFGGSKVKFSIMESQISSIRKAPSRYDSQKSSESADELGVDLFETINQIEHGHTIENSSRAGGKGKTKKPQSKSLEITRWSINDVHLEKLRNLNISLGAAEMDLDKRKPLMRRKVQKK